MNGGYSSNSYRGGYSSKPSRERYSSRNNYNSRKNSNMYIILAVIAIVAAGILLIVVNTSIIMNKRNGVDVGENDKSHSSKSQQESVTTEAETVSDSYADDSDSGMEGEMSDGAPMEGEYTEDQDNDLDDSFSDSSDESEAENDAGAAETPGDGQIFPNSSDEYLSESDVSGLSKEDAQEAINEIYARNGYTFRDENIYNHFCQYDWYHPTIAADNFTESEFSQLEIQNIRLLEKYR